jgi:hypothetical protein
MWTFPEASLELIQSSLNHAFDFHAHIHPEPSPAPIPIDKQLTIAFPISPPSRCRGESCAFDSHCNREYPPNSCQRFSVTRFFFQTHQHHGRLA